MASAGQAARPVPAILTDVGYNPYRRFKAKPADYVLVAVCIALAIALLAWALVG